MPRSNGSDNRRSHQHNGAEGLSSSGEGMVLVEQTDEWRQLQAGKEQCYKAKRDLMSEKHYMEEQRNEKKQEEVRRLNKELDSENKLYYQDFIKLQEGIKQAKNDLERSDAESRLSTRMHEFYDKSRSIMVESDKKINDIEQNYQQGIYNINMQLNGIEQELFSLDLKEAALRSAFAERTPTPPGQNDVTRWRD
jgi:ATP-dependent Lon protease